MRHALLACAVSVIPVSAASEWPSSPPIPAVGEIAERTERAGGLDPERAAAELNGIFDGAGAAIEAPAVAVPKVLREDAQASGARPAPAGTHGAALFAAHESASEAASEADGTTGVDGQERPDKRRLRVDIAFAGAVFLIIGAMALAASNVPLAVFAGTLVGVMAASWVQTWYS